MIFTYVLIFFFVVILSIFGLYFLNAYVFPRKIEEIAQMIEAGQTKLAIKKLLTLLEEDDRNAYAHYLLAEAYMKESNDQYAIVEYRQVLKLNKFDDKVTEIDIRKKLAKIFKNKRNFGEAKKEYLILTKIDPSNYESYYELGQILFNAGVLDKAAGYFKKSISLNGKQAQAFYLLGQIFYRTGVHSDAKQMFIEAIKLEPQNYKSHYFLGLVLRHIGDHDWAVKEFEIAQHDEEIRVKCFLAKGTCFLERDQLPKAVVEFERGLKLVPKGSDTEVNLLYFLADAQERMRDITSAISNWERIFSINKKFRDVEEKLRQYAEFRQDDRIKDFMIAGLAKFEHICRKLVEAMEFTVVNIEVVNDTEIEITAIATEGKWRNTRQSNQIVRIVRSTDVINDGLLRRLHESMKLKNATRIVVISTADYSQAAIDFSNTRPIELMPKAELVRRLKEISY